MGRLFLSVDGDVGSGKIACVTPENRDPFMKRNQSIFREAIE